jgi:hypothetical protein
MTPYNDEFVLHELRDGPWSSWGVRGKGGEPFDQYIWNPTEPNLESCVFGLVHAWGMAAGPSFSCLSKCSTIFSPDGFLETGHVGEAQDGCVRSIKPIGGSRRFCRLLEFPKRRAPSGRRRGISSRHLSSIAPASRTPLSQPLPCHATDRLNRHLAVLGRTLRSLRPSPCIASWHPDPW